MMKEITSYISHFIATDNPVLQRIDETSQQRTDIRPGVGPEVGRMLSVLVKTINAQRVLELGSGVGYSTIWLGEALRQTGGKLVSVEFEKRIFEEALDNVKEAGLEDIVTIIHGDAKEVTAQLDGQFDLILQDSGKSMYTEMLDSCIKLTRLNGLIVADDTLFKPMGLPPQYSKPMHNYNELVFASKRLYSTILPIGDGITLSIRLE